MRKMSINEILSILRKQGCDDAHYEAKSCAQDLSKDVWESVSAFANTDGGTLLLGINERDGFAPVKDFRTDRVCDQFVSGMGDGGSPSCLTNPPEYHIERVVCENEIILVVRIDELPISQKPCYIKARGVLGGSYKRIDDKDIRLSENEVYALQSATIVDQSDRELVDGATVSDLNEAVYEAAFYRSLQLAPRSLHGASDTSERLRRLNFTDSQGFVMRAGLLVAGKYPQQFFPKLHVDVAVHPGVAKGASGELRFCDRTICEGTLGEMIEDAVAAVVKNLRRRSVVRGVGRYDELEIPEIVLREAIVNALVHRSYNKRFDGESVAVDIFDDRVEIINPGGLWGKSRVDLADGRSCCRNATIMKLMSFISLPSGTGFLAEGNGTGIPLMMAEMKKNHLDPPEFYPAMDHFKVILRRLHEEGRHSAVVAEKADAVEPLLQEGGEMSIRELAEKSGMSISQARRRVKDLIDRGIVEATAPPTSKNRKYRLV